METRATTTAQARLTTRAAAQGTGRTIRGYAATYDSPAVITDIRGRQYCEVIRSGAFDRTLIEQPDIRLLRDHDPASLMGRTTSGTLRVGADEVGLWFEADLPDTQAARDMAESIRRGDLDSCSFGFGIKQDAWIEAEKPTRELRDVDLYEVSVVAFPAYTHGTSVDLRSVQAAKARDPLAKAKARLRLIEAGH